ncbi:PucR family transcriptional regulator [Gorillibacterium massiliense]|uniref:PucR family transcriptional regulator n=1 Tax=Gorillibacterium massiliense TaxID=1280390 RepID=UPI0004AE62A7|nr:helix-turn-helix domain-containing protein [Gorillibacterium massiliense]
MDWEKIRKQLEAILGVKISMRKITSDEWTQTAGPLNKRSAAREMGGETAYWLETSGSSVIAFVFDGKKLSEAERELVALTLDVYRQRDKAKTASPVGEEERKAQLVRDWFMRQLELGHTEEELPEPLASQLTFYKTRIPILLYGEFSNTHNVSYRELKKLLESFFDAEISLIALMDKEWLILGPENIVSESFGGNRDDGNEESLEDTLTSICEGLYEMLSNEWVGECHLAVHYPMNPAKALLSTVIGLRETIMLGKAFHLGKNIHLPWELRLEKLMNEIPDPMKLVFVRQIFKGNDPLLDAEILTTLETFFMLECNVSETAKKLYIHRNTLLYRLDKFKQETGLDVRLFNDAVLVKIALLLYKVTKRQ